MSDLSWLNPTPHALTSLVRSRSRFLIGVSGDAGIITRSSHLHRCAQWWKAKLSRAHGTSPTVAVGTCVSSHAPRTEPYVRLSRIREKNPRDARILLSG